MAAGEATKAMALSTEANGDEHVSPVRNGKLVLVALDESGESYQGLSWALENLALHRAEADSDSDEVVLLHVQHTQPINSNLPGPGIITQELIETVEKQEESTTQQILQSAKDLCEERNVKARTIVKSGDPRDHICETIEKLRADVLVMGNHGHGAMKRYKKLQKNARHSNDFQDRAAPTQVISTLQQFQNTILEFHLVLHASGVNRQQELNMTALIQGSREWRIEQGLAPSGNGPGRCGRDFGVLGASTTAAAYKNHTYSVQAAIRGEPENQDLTKLLMDNTKCGQGREALRLYDKMREEGMRPSISVFIAALKACSSLEDLQSGKKIHSNVIESGNDSNSYVGNILVDMYAKCESMVDARQVFDRMPQHGVVSWNAIILGYARNGEAELALQLFARMQREGCAPDARTFVAALKACASLAENEQGKQVEGKLVKIGCLEKGIAIHSQAVKSGHELNIFVTSTLVDMYAKCGSMVDARWVFDRMPHHSVVLWNAIILGYARSEEGELALQLYARMQPEGCAPDSRTFVAALKACASLAEKEEGKQVEQKVVKIGSLEKGIAIHSQAAKSGHFSNVHVENTLVDMYAKCGSMVDAWQVFERMPHHDVVSWNAIILGYAESGEGELALQLFARMEPEGCAPNRITFLAALKACCSLATQEEGMEVEGKILKLGCLKEGISIHSQATKSGDALNNSVANTLVDMYAKCGSMVDALRVFDKMLHHDVVSWNAIILGYAQSGEGEWALQLFARMQREGCAPNRVTFLAALKACGSLAALETGKQVYSEICSARLQSDAVVATCLVDFYGKCGSMADAEQVFDSIATRDIVTWNALIAGYGRQGDTKHVFDLFQRMQKEVLQPNESTFLSILTVCSHAGLVDKGKEYFQAMCSDYGITPSIDHYTCMVDLLGRANQLDDVVAMVNNMPCKPDMVMWMTVLGACQKWRNVGVGRLAFESVLRLDDKHAAGYVLMSNIYEDAGMFEESKKVQAMRREASTKLVD